MNVLLSALFSLVRISVKLFFLVLPSLLVFAVLTNPVIMFNRGVPAIGSTEHTAIHELFPQSSWNDLVPCGQYFNEVEEFRKARSCVNQNVWSDRPLTEDELEFPIPRCYVIKAQSPNVLSKDGINFLPIFDYNGLGAVVGVYQPETRTVFVVENIDAPQVYRHELQHYFLHEHDPETTGGGHDQPIWEKCEPPYYEPSDKAKVLIGLETSKTTE
jgi:hypothetical protein